LPEPTIVTIAFLATSKISRSDKSKSYWNSTTTKTTWFPQKGNPGSHHLLLDDPTGISQIDYMTFSHSTSVKGGTLLHYVKGSHEWQPVISELARYIVSVFCHLLLTF
jgi:hypothetical protein